MQKGSWIGLILSFKKHISGSSNPPAFVVSGVWLLWNIHHQLWVLIVTWLVGACVMSQNGADLTRLARSHGASAAVIGVSMWGWVHSGSCALCFPVPPGWELLRVRKLWASFVFSQLIFSFSNCWLTLESSSQVTETVSFVWLCTCAPLWVDGSVALIGVAREALSDGISIPQSCYSLSNLCGPFAAALLSPRKDEKPRTCFVPGARFAEAL